MLDILFLREVSPGGEEDRDVICYMGKDGDEKGLKGSKGGRIYEVLRLYLFLFHAFYVFFYCFLYIFFSRTHAQKKVWCLIIYRISNAVLSFLLLRFAISSVGIYVNY